jgi:selenide, water dikinase
MGPGDLQDVLGDLRQQDHADLLVGLGRSDDAAVYRVSDDVAIVETVDFFPPIVDDPYLFGAIAAANSMSDIYAMGGHVLFALNVAGFPRDLPKEVIAAVFRGGADKVREAGGIIAGGHTVVDAEPKYGLCVTGRVDPRRILIKGGLRAGQRVFLTKPLGTGVIATAAKNDRTDAPTLEGAIASMLRLNRVAAEVAQQTGASGATDITGFGLLGHAGEMVEASGAGIELRARDLPLLPGALALAQADVFSGGMGRNRRHIDAAFGAAGRFHVAPSVPEPLVKLLCESETSGGLLFAVDAERAAEVFAAFSRCEEPVWEVGTVTGPPRLAIV